MTKHNTNKGFEDFKDVEPTYLIINIKIGTNF